MKYRFVRICLFLISVLSAFNAYAKEQNVSFKANVPNVVGVGEVFTIEFTSNVKGSFSPPSSFGESVEVIAGPQTSSFTEVSMVNGSFKQENRYTITYVLRSDTEGEFTIGSSTINVDGKDYTTSPVTVRVIQERTSNGGATSGNNAQRVDPSRQRANPSASTSISKDDIIIVPTIDKTKVFKGEPVKLTFKLYSTLACNLTDIKLPNFNGFWTQPLDVSNYQPKREEYNGRLYNSYIIYQTLLFPQQTGELTIDRMEATAIVQYIKEASKGRSVFDDMFGPEIQEEKVRLSTSPLKLTVKEFPAGAPASFSGAVGEFELNAEPLPSEVTANSAFTYKLKLSGHGNLPQIQAPKLTLPSSFEQYNVTVTGSLNNSANGVSGYRQFEYPIIARSEGNFTIGEVEFTYLNPSTASYITLRIPEKHLQVTPDTNGNGSGGGMLISGLSKEDVRILGSDIRYIKSGNAHLKPRDRALMSGAVYIICLLTISGVFVFLLFFLRKKLQEMRNNALMKGRKANKVALQRFRIADKYMKEDNQRGFYEEMLKALWGYMSDKLNIPVAHLTKDNIRGELIRKGISEDVAMQYINIIGECEYAQYAPVIHGKMSEIYVSGVEVITKLESILGK